MGHHGGVVGVHGHLRRSNRFNPRMNTSHEPGTKLKNWTLASSFCETPLAPPFLARGKGWKP